VETSAGAGSGFENDGYLQAGARIVDVAADVWDADMVCKVKEPLPEEYPFLRPDLVLFTYLHLAAERSLSLALLEKKVTGIAYETVQLRDGALPLLTPMSEVAGRMAVQVGVHLLEKTNGGRGVLLGSVPGVKPGVAVIVGGGVVGSNAAKMAVGLGARVIVLDINAQRLRHLDDIFNGRVETVMSNEFNIARAVAAADLLIGAVLLAGARAPTLVSEEMVQSMKPGSVIVDVAIDQGGCVETIDHVTYHGDPTYVRHGVVHYSVGNMPGAVPHTSTLALTNVTLPHILHIAENGFRVACKADCALAHGLNTLGGNVTHEAVARSLGYDCTPAEQLL
jgi:alanine dehydrogenase